MAPLATDMYLPALPDIAAEMGAPAATVQLTLSAFLLGMGFGQYVIGAISDRLGRRPLFMVGFALALVSSVAAALAWNIWVLIAARFFMGLGSAAGAVLARAIISDRTSGALLGKQLSLMMVIQSVMPIAAPVVGSLLVPVVGWRGTMWVLVGATSIFLVLITLMVPETLPAAHRSAQPLWEVLLAPFKLLGSGHFALLLLTFASGFGLIFAYISASSYVLQELLGLGKLQYGLVFAINAIVMTGAAALNARLVDRFRFTQIMFVGLTIMAFGVTGVLVDALGTPSLIPLVGLVAVASAGVGLVLPNATTLLMQDAKERGRDGAGSAIIGAVQALAAAVVAPLVGLGGETSAVPMAVVMVTCAALALLGAAGAAMVRRRS